MFQTVGSILLYDDTQIDSRLTGVAISRETYITGRHKETNKERHEERELARQEWERERGRSRREKGNYIDIGGFLIGGLWVKGGDNTLSWNRLDDGTQQRRWWQTVMMSRMSDVPLVNSSLVTDRDSERITIFGQLWNKNGRSVPQPSGRGLWGSNWVQRGFCWFVLRDTLN